MLGNQHSDTTVVKSMLPQIKLLTPTKDFENTHKDYTVGKIITNTRM